MMTIATAAPRSKVIAHLPVPGEHLRLAGKPGQPGIGRDEALGRNLSLVAGNAVMSESGRTRSDTLAVQWQWFKGRGRESGLL